MQIWHDLNSSRTAISGFVVIGIGWASFSAQMPAIKAQIGASDAAFGTMGLMGAVGAVMAMWLAPFVHGLLGRWAMLFGTLVMLAGFNAVGLATGPVSFTLSMFLAAAGAGVADVLANTEVSEAEARSGRNLMNLNHGLFSVSYAIAATVVSFARGAEWSPWQIFAFMSVLVLLLAPGLVLPSRKGEEEREVATHGLPHGIVWLGGLVVLAAFLGEAASEGWSALHLERTLGGSPAEGALGPAILGLSMSVGRIGGHLIFGKTPPLRLMVLAMICATAGLCLAGAALNLPTAYLGLALGGLGTSVVGPLALGLIGQSVPGKLRLAAISRAAALGYGAFFIGPPLMGFVAESYGLRVAFYSVGGVLAFVVVAILPIWARRLRR